MNCFSCLHSRTCFMRIEVTRTIQSFKLLAEDSIEAKNTNRTHSVGDMWGTIAGACTEYKDKPIDEDPGEYE